MTLAQSSEKVSGTISGPVSHLKDLPYDLTDC